MGAARRNPRGGQMPMEPVSCRPPDDFPQTMVCVSGGVEDKYGMIIYKKAAGDLWIGRLFYIKKKEGMRSGIDNQP